MVFLDKTGIHQTDLERQRPGILKLGAFLRSSKHMVSLYTDVYLIKLWTVYEIACFLALHSVSNIIVVPTFQPIFILCGIASSYVLVVLYPLIGGRDSIISLVSNLMLSL